MMKLKQRLWNARRKAAKMIAPGTLQLGGYVDAVHIRGRDGKVTDLGRHNAIMNQGKNYILDTMFNEGTQILEAAWFISLVNASGWTAWAVTDVMSSKSWTEWTAYDEGTRPVWSADAASGQAVSNGTPITFTINSGGTVKGVFIVATESTKGGTAGTPLWAAAPFSGGDVPVSADDQLKVTYTVST